MRQTGTGISHEHHEHHEKRDNYNKPRGNQRGYKRGGNWRGPRGGRGQRGGYRGGDKDGQREDRGYHNRGSEGRYYKQYQPRPFRPEPDETETPQDDSWNVVTKRAIVKQYKPRRGGQAPTNP